MKNDLVVIKVLPFHEILKLIIDRTALKLKYQSFSLNNNFAARCTRTSVRSVMILVIEYQGELYQHYINFMFFKNSAKSLLARVAWGRGSVRTHHRTNVMSHTYPK